MACLFETESIKVNEAASANTLAGKYKAPYKGHSQYVGHCLLDEDLEFSVLSYYQFHKQGLITSDDAGDNFQLVFPTLNNLKLHFRWVEGILAGNCLPLVQAIEASKVGTAMPTIGQHFTQLELDKPSTLMKQMKMVQHLSNSQIKVLDAVHHGLRNMYSPSKADLKKRVLNELINVNFTADDVEKYFSIFKHDLGALKSRTEDEKVHNKPNIQKLLPHQALLSGDVLTCAGLQFLVMVLVTPGEDRTSMVFGDFLTDHKSETLSDSIIRIGSHVQAKYNMQIAIVEFDRDKSLDNHIASTHVETSLNCEIVHVSTKACYAESANKHIKNRVRSKVASLRYFVTRTILLYIVVAAINNLNLTTRSGNAGKSAKFTLTNEKTDYRSYFALSPSDLTEVHVNSNNNVLHYRSVTAIPLIPCHNNHTDWIFFSLETGQLVIRDYRHARIVPWSYEARLRMQYLATLDPVSADADIHLRAIEIPMLYHETAKRHRVPRFRRDRNRRARLNPEPNPDHNINGAAEEIDHAENDELEQLDPNDIQIEPDADPPDLDAVIAATTMTDENPHSLQAQLEDMPVYNGTEELFDFQSLQTDSKSEVGVYSVYSTTLHQALNSDTLLSMQEDGTEIRAKERSNTSVTLKPFHTFRDTIMVTKLANGKMEVSNLGLGVDIECCAIIDYSSMREGYLFSTPVTARNALKTFGEDGIKAIR